eukprot:gene38777-47892_t
MSTCVINLSKLDGREIWTKLKNRNDPKYNQINITGVGVGIDPSVAQMMCPIREEMNECFDIYLLLSNSEGEGYGIGRKFCKHDVAYFSGWVSRGKFNGEGTLKYFSVIDPSIMTGEYRGHFLDNCISGQGTYMNCEGVYTGEWLKNMKCGMGSMQTTLGDRYVGQWRNNHQSGEGMIAYRSGGTYKGQWLS